MDALVKRENEKSAVATGKIIKYTAFAYKEGPVQYTRKGTRPGSYAHASAKHYQKQGAKKAWQESDPEEILAGAYAASFTAQISALLVMQNFATHALNAMVILTLAGGVITHINLTVSGYVAGMNAERFEKIVQEAAKTCTISKAMQVAVTYESHFVE